MGFSNAFNILVPSKVQRFQLDIPSYPCGLADPRRASLALLRATPTIPRASRACRSAHPIACPDRWTLQTPKIDTTVGSFPLLLNVSFSV